MWPFRGLSALPALALLASLCAGALAPATAARGPFLRLSEREVDFGTVDQLQQVHHALTLSNEGDAPLRILKVETSCGCTVAVPSDSIVPPGRQVTLDVAFSTRDYEGPQEKDIVLKTNDPAEPKIVIPVRADVRALIRLSQDKVDFDRIPSGETPSEKVRVAADKADGLAVTSISGGEKFFETAMTPESTPKEEVVWLTVKIRRDAPIGIFREVVSFRTKRPKGGTTKILVTGQITSYFVVKGDGRIRLTPIPAGRTADASVTITCDGSKPYRLQGVETGLPYVTGEIRPMAANEYEVRFTVMKTAPPGMIKQQVKILTSDPKQPEIELSMQGQVRGKDDNAGAP